ncbi:unnamed protein product (macronuclear) [Paramecium tetraurelia]|uniref:Chromosome undetermined scaffold_133, whole genome shotgun sequence n=1 Tax=Paramecium tetraurelia TaxID=5888 RepID=Q3SDT6_PARTE|nr:uncharacterized protein GSPATT00032977001 [Paramecium tetraurelia]CAI39272.1 rab_C84 [Paramecium tetraurelia]CAK63125.1 unnamed protein product [Paramecium tetraurelia]|eukprot:XP_001430523.1 hypothetical protein (macronuclear) [Paramecium tetraurelia strain d4-2]
MNRENQFKIVLLGDQGVGKTSISNVYVKKEFNSYENATSGANYHSQICKIDNHQINFAVRLQIQRQIWDTAGQEKFKSLARLYYRDSNAALLVYDVTNYKSFQRVTDWINELNENSEPALKFIVGNKIDQVDKEEVSYDAAKQLAENYGCFLRLVSAKEKNGIFELFESVGRELLKNQQDNQNPMINQPPQTTNKPLVQQMPQAQQSEKCC